MRTARDPLATWSVALVAVSLAALLCAEERSRLYLPVAVAACACLLRLHRRAVPEAVWTALSLAAFPFFFLDRAVISGSSLLAAVHLLLYLIVNKVHHLKTARDHDQLLLVSLLVQLAVCVLAVEAVVVAALAVYLVVALRILELLHLRRELDAAAPTARATAARSRAYAAAAGAFALALALFFIFPRVGAGTVESSIGKPQLVSGFRAGVDLEEIGRIKENNTLVARLEPRSGQRDGLSLLRAVAYRDFDGKRWSRDDVHMRMLRVEAEESVPLDAARTSVPLSWYDITMEPLEPAVVPVPVRPAFVSGLSAWLLRDAAGSLFVRPGRRGAERLRYAAAADLTTVSIAAIRSEQGDEPSEIAAYKALPELDPRFRRLAADLAPAAASRQELVAAVTRTLAGYRYSLETPGGDDPLGRFLFETRAGHCELFASAAAVLLRLRGVPARVVNGFRVSEWSDFGSYYIVRQADAHAWIEVYVRGSGWIGEDPTPPDPERNRWTLGMRSYSQVLDFALFYWDRYVLAWRLADQIDAFETLLEAIGRWTARLRSGSVGLLLGLGAGALAVLAWWAARRRAVSPASQARALYGELRERLRRAGFPISPAVAPGELRRLAADVSGAAAVIDFYIRARFGGGRIEPADLARARVDLDRARRTLSHGAGPPSRR